MRSEAALYLLALLILLFNDPTWASAEIRGCNRTIRNSVGWIRWTGRMGRCIVRIKAPLRDPQVIEVKVRRLQVGFLREARCEGAYFQFSDSLDDPDDEAGRYCGYVTGNTTRLFLRRGPNLTITLTSDAQFASANPVVFSAQFSILPFRLAIERHRGYTMSTSFSCPVECTIRNKRRSCRLTSPGYPSVYPRGIRCKIAFESSAGRFRIGGQPDDLFDLMNYTDQKTCQAENCEASLQSKALSQLSPIERIARSQDRVEMRDESIIGIEDNRFGYENGRVVSVIGQNIEQTSEQLTRQRRTEKKAMRYRKKQYHKERPNKFNTDEFQRESRLRVKSMRSKKNQRGVVPSYYFGGDFERRNEMAGSALISEHRHPVKNRSSDNVTCDGDYLAFLEDVNGKVFEISKFCGSGQVPRIFSRGKNVILEFFARQDGTVMHDGFQVTLQEERDTDAGRTSCEFVYRSFKRARENIKSPRNWYPPNTVCSYTFLGRTTEKVAIHIKILRNEIERVKSTEINKRNISLNYCPGNEIAVYNSAQENGNFLMWSYCDASHWDINNIQVPLTSSGNELLIRYYSAKGSYDGQGFTYTISYRFVKKERNTTAKRVHNKYKPISLKPVDLSTLNLNDTDNCNCNFDNGMGSFKNWFVLLMILGIVSFLGAVITIVGLIAKFLKIRSGEKKLLQSAKQ